MLRRGEKPDASTQIRNVEIAAHELAKLAEKHELVLTHGNGPQVGVLALQSANDERLSEPYPFDTLGAQTQGMIGYWLLQAMQNALPGWLRSGAGWSSPTASTTAASSAPPCRSASSRPV